jgi:hypothetical protein
MKVPVLVMLIFCVGLVFASQGHSGNEAFVYVNGKSMSLQGAINAGEFSGSSYSGGGSYSGSFNFGHDEIYVRVAGSDKTFQEAIDDGSLCGFDGGSYGSYSKKASLGQVGDEINVIIGGVEMNLQKAINDGHFTCCSDTSWSPSPSTKCSGTSFVQTSNCGATRWATGTKTSGSCCVATSWSPNTNTVCSGTSFVQTSNCGTTRSNTGTKPLRTVCYDPAGGFHYMCMGGSTLGTSLVRYAGNGNSAVASDTIACMNYCNSVSGTTCCQMEYKSTTAIVCSAKGNGAYTYFVRSSFGEIYNRLWASSCSSSC